MNDSVLQDWMMQIPIRMQSTLVLGLRGPDTHVAPNIKKLVRWLRGLTFKPGNPANIREFMARASELPQRIEEKGPIAKELEFCTQHYYSHLMHAIEVVAYKHNQKWVRDQALQYYKDLCDLFHLPIESREDFGQRLRQVIWAGEPQPDTIDEALDIFSCHPSFEHEFKQAEERYRIEKERTRG